MAPWQFFLLSAFSTAVITVLCMHLALIPWRKSIGSHWTERARLLWPARKTSLGIIFACCLSGGFMAALWDIEHETLTFLGIATGFFAGNFVSVREIEPRYHFLIWAYELFWNVLVQFGMLGIFIWLLATMPDFLTPADWLRAALGTLAVIIIAAGLWLPLFKLFPRPLKPEEIRLNAIVADAAAQTGITPRWTFYGKSPRAQAAALPYLRSLVITSRVMEVLDDVELRSIILHEMAHLRENFAVQFSRLIPILALMLFIFIHPVMHRLGPSGFLVLGTAAWLLIRFAQSIARRMEHRADDAAVVGSGDPVPYARALEKIYQVNQLPAVMRGSRMTHPHLYDRMLTAGVTPDYPRPLPPAAIAWPGWAVFLIPILVFSWSVGERVSEKRSRQPPPVHSAR